MAGGKERTSPAPRRRGVAALLLLALCVATTASISQVWTRLQAIEYGYKISEASRENAKLLEVNRRLRIEVTLLKRPERIARLASEQLGMTAPRPAQVRRLWLRQPAARPGDALARAPQ